MSTQYIQSMSNTLTTAITPLWRPGNKGNIEFVASFKRLEREDQQTSKLIEQREGFTAQIGEFEYHVGRNQFGLWLSRRRMGLEGLHNIGQTPYRACYERRNRPSFSSNLGSNI